MLDISLCNLCPRECGVDRTVQMGFCRSGSQIKVARAALHFWEEPCISGSNGSGTVFFSGCSLQCCYCQNYQISKEGVGKEITPERLAQIFLELQIKGAHNINLVTATHFIPCIMKALDLAKSELDIPIIYNSSGYERMETIEALKGYIDIYLPDFKYYSNKLALEYSKADDYFKFASEAIAKMIEQTNGLQFSKQGIMQKGVIIRHMVLPGGKDDSLAILKWMDENLPKDKFMLSLMSQYTPMQKNLEYKNLNRRITSLEYKLVMQEAIRLGFSDGYIQDMSSAKGEFTPLFDLEGI